MITLHYGYLKGKRIGYSSETSFHIQVGRGRKGSYRTLHSFKGSLEAVVSYWNFLTPKPGEKMRLLMDGSPKPLAFKSSF